MPDVNPPQNPASKHTPTVRPRGLSVPHALPALPPVRSIRAAKIVRWFGLGDAMKQRATDAPAPDAPGSAPVALALAPGTITLVTGPSGAGKSTLLRDAQRSPVASDARPILWIDLATIALPDAPVVDCLHADDEGDADDDVRDASDKRDERDERDSAASAACGFAISDAPLRAALLDLARVGLGEAWTYLRTPAELSDGQRWRLKLAIALDAARRATANDNARVILLADEFAALLDRVTACVVARSLRRMIGPGSSLAVVVATSHADLMRPLAPDVLVRCDFGCVTMQEAPTISKSLPHKAADGIGGLSGLQRVRAPRATPADAIGGFIKSKPGASMRKIIIASFAALALFGASSIARADINTQTRAASPAPAGGNDRLLSEPRSPFDPPRTLFEFDPRPSRRPIMPLYPTVERELDGGAGRIESDVEFDLRRQQRDQDERRGVAREERAFDSFDEQRDRDLRIETQQRRDNRDARAQQRVETESQRLAADRARFYRSAGIDATGAAHDTRQLRSLERAYQRDVRQMKRNRAAALKRLAKDDSFSAHARRIEREALDIGHRAAQAERRARYAHDRARVLGTE